MILFIVGVQKGITFLSRCQRPGIGNKKLRLIMLLFRFSPCVDSAYYTGKITVYFLTNPESEPCQTFFLR